MSDIFQTYFAFILASLGYPVDDIRWSLGYCQGDGMRFTGCVDAKVVARRLLADKPVFMGLVFSAVGKGERINITASEHRYVHEHTMTADRSYDTDLTLAEDKAMSLLLSLVEEDIVSISQRLRDDGYSCIEAAPSDVSVVVDRTFGDFGLRVSVQQEEAQYLADSGDRLYDLLDMIEVAKGRQGAVMVSVRSNTTGKRSVRRNWVDFPSRATGMRCPVNETSEATCASCWAARVRKCGRFSAWKSGGIRPH